jgi:hypothetical protein
MKHVMIAAICMAAGGAAAAGLSINHVPMPGGSSLQACLQRGGNALQQAGLRRLNNTAAAAWAENASSDQLYTVYCVMETGTMVIAGSGPSGESVAGMVGTVRNILRGAGGKQ